MKISIILPVLNEAEFISRALKALQSYRSQVHEVIVVDGGSRDDTLALAQSAADQVLVSRPGRALQMNAGAAVATGDVLLFLHADSLLPDDAYDAITAVIQSGKTWGRFNVRLSGQSWMFRIIERMMNWRSCLTSIVTGDQAIFVNRQLFIQVNGFPEIPLMEDIALSKKLRKHSRCACLKSLTVTSSRKWEKNGIAATVLLMWRLRLMYFFGVSADKLASQYYR